MPVFLTISEGESGDDTQPLFATCDQRLVAAVIRELQLLAQDDTDADVARQPMLHTGSMPAKNETRG
jgi:hypothetical protein